MTKQFEYTPKNAKEIIIRKFAFDFPEDLDPVWVPNNPVRSHLTNGLSLTMPYIEPFIIKSTLRAIEFISEEELLEDIRGFNRQEAQHYQCHRRLNDLLKANGYPELGAVEQRISKSFERLSKRSLRTQLAYNAGFECMTNGFTHWFLTKRVELFKDASPHITSFWLMHMVEEAEHNTVAFDVYMAYSGKYLPRVIGVFHGTFHIWGWGIVGMLTALKKDKILLRPRTLLKILQELGSAVLNVGPFMFRALWPGYNPRQVCEPKWYDDWVAGHAAMGKDDPLPLVDTADPEMPVPFDKVA
jgi:predicted metal-dependent hydrolase|tara:strand:+ start:1445 stop:2344 length:900 start_codon:yes stop_codon:yes gene_type:complete